MAEFSRDPGWVGGLWDQDGRIAGAWHRGIDAPSLLPLKVLRSPQNVLFPLSRKSQLASCVLCLHLALWV